MQQCGGKLMFSSQPSAWGTHGGSLDQEGWIQLRIPPDGHSHGGGHRIHLEQGKTGFEQQHFGEMSLVWQAETSPGIAGGQLWSSGRWRLSLSAKTSKHQNHQTPNKAAAVPQPGPVHHEKVKFQGVVYSQTLSGPAGCASAALKIKP